MIAKLNKSFQELYSAIKFAERGALEEILADKMLENMKLKTEIKELESELGELRRKKYLRNP